MLIISSLHRMDLLFLLSPLCKAHLNINSNPSTKSTSLPSAGN